MGRKPGTTAPIYTARLPISKAMKNTYEATMIFEKIRGIVEVGVTYDKHPYLGQQNTFTKNQNHSVTWFYDPNQRVSSFHTGGSVHYYSPQEIYANDQITVTITPNESKVKFTRNGKVWFEMDGFFVADCAGFMFTASLTTEGDKVRIVNRKVNGSSERKTKIDDSIDDSKTKNHDSEDLYDELGEDDYSDYYDLQANLGEIYVEIDENKTSVQTSPNDTSVEVGV